MSHFAFTFFLQNIDHLREIEVVKQLGNILKTNVRGCKSVGHPFVTQLGRIYLDMLNVYRCLSENISVAIAENGEIVTKQPPRTSIMMLYHRPPKFTLRGKGVM